MTILANIGNSARFRGTRLSRHRAKLLKKKAEGGRFELPDPFGSPIFKTGGFNRSPTPPWRVAEAREIALAGAACKPSQ